MIEEENSWEIFQDEDSGIYFLSCTEGEKKFVESLNATDLVHAKKKADKYIKLRHAVLNKKSKQQIASEAAEEFIVINEGLNG